MSLGVPSSSLSNEALRNLDPSLSFALTIQNHQALLLQTSSSSISGILQALGEGQAYAESIRKLHVLVDSLQQSIEYAKTKEFTPAIAAQTQAHKNEVFKDLHRWVDQASSSISGWNTTLNGISPSRSAGQGLVTNLRNALTTYSNALTQARDGNFSPLNSAVSSFGTILQSVNQELSTVTGLKDAAYARWEKSKKDSDLTEYQSLVAEETKLTNLKNLATTINNGGNDIKNKLSSDLAAIYKETPTVQDLGGEITVATWGTSGGITIMAPNNVGLRIYADGTVDSLGSDTKDWKVTQKTTFVFAEGVKITLSPGTPASVQAILGNEIMTISNLQKGQTPSTVLDNGGREIDAASKDGQIVNYNAASGYWMHGDSNSLGDISSRETFASGQDDEALVCGVDIAIPEELITYFEQFGIDVPDLDNDGRLNEQELMTVNFMLNQVIAIYQQMYSDAMARVREATESLKALTNFMGRVRGDQHASEMDDLQLTPEQQDELRLIEQRLEKVMSSTPALANNPKLIGETAMRAVQESPLQSTQSNPQSVQGAFPNSNSGSTSAPPPSQGPSNPVQVPMDTSTAPSPAFSRASRLLGTSTQAQELLALFQQAATEPAVGAKDGATLESLNEWLESDELDPAVLLEGLTVLLELGKELELSPEILESLAAFSALVQSSSAEGLDIELSLPIQVQLREAAFSDDEIEALSSVIAKVELVMGVEGKVPNLLSEVGLGQLTSALLSFPQGLRGEVQEKYVAFVETLAKLSPTELRGALETWPTREGEMESQPFAEAFKAFSTAYALNAPVNSVAANQMTAVFGTQTSQSPLSWLREVANWGKNVGIETSSRDLGPGVPSRDLGLGVPSRDLGPEVPSREAGTELLNQWSQRMNRETPQPNQGLLGWNSPTTFNTAVELEMQRDAALQVIANNMMTPAELLRRFESNLRQATEFFKIQMRDAEQLFHQAQNVVNEFFEVLKRDDLGKDVIKSDHLSDELLESFTQRMKEFRLDLGIEWGSSETSGNPAQESKRVNRMMQSGMMV